VLCGFRGEPFVSVQGAFECYSQGGKVTQSAGRNEGRRFKSIYRRCGLRDEKVNLLTAVSTYEALGALGQEFLRDA